MDIFVRNLPPQSTRREVENFLTGPLARCNIHDFHIEKRRRNTFGKLSVLDVSCARNFLSNYGVTRNAPRGAVPRYNLFWCGKPLQFREDRDDPGRHAVGALQHEAIRRATERSRAGSAPRVQQDPASTRFNITEIRCGLWDYLSPRHDSTHSQLAFVPYFSDRKPGTVTFGLSEAVIILHDLNLDQYRLHFHYRDVDHIVVPSHSPDQTVTIGLKVAPKVYKVEVEDDLTAALAGIRLGSSATRASETKKVRLTSVSDAHSKVAGTCFVYQVVLYDYTKVANIRTMLGSNPRISESVTAMTTGFLYPPESFHASATRLDHQLTDESCYGRLPFAVLYQASALSTNGLLHPLKVLELLPKIANIHDTRGLDTVLSALRSFRQQMPWAGPEVDASQTSSQALEGLLGGFADDFDQYHYDPEDIYLL